MPTATVEAPPPIVQDGHYRYFADIEGIELDDKNSTWVQILPLGEFSHPKYGPVSITAEKIAEMVKNFKDKVRGNLVDLNFAHRNDVAKGDKAAGWFQDVEARPTGLWGKVEFTSEAAGEVKDKAWRGISAEYADNWCNESSPPQCFTNVLFGAALTNRPYMKQMAPINFAELAENKANSDMAVKQSGMRMSPGEMAQHLYVQHDMSPKVGVGALYDQHAGIDHTGIEDHTHYPFGLYEEDPNEEVEMEESTVLGERPADWQGYSYEMTEADSDWLTKEYRDIPMSVRNKMPAADFAGKAKSFPIEVCGDVRAAWTRVNTSNQDSASLYSRIISIAKRKGFTKCLPKTAQAKLTEIEGRETRVPKLREVLGLAEDASDEAVATRIKELDDFWKTKHAEEDKTRKFEEDYPEQARIMREQGRQLAEERAANTLKEWNRQGLPPALNPMVKAMLLGDEKVTLSEDGKDTEITVNFGDIMSKLLAKGLVPMKPSGATNEGEETVYDDPREELEARVKKYMEEHKDEKPTYREARLAVARADKELAQAVVNAAPNAATAR